MGNYTTAVQLCKQQQRKGVFCVIHAKMLQARKGGWWITEVEDCCSVVVESCCEKLVAEAGASSGTKRKGNIHRWKPLPSNG
jgi:hypothetical protein